MDWSDKKEAHEIDTACFNLRNGHTNKQFHPGAARYQEIQSTPESWAQVHHMNLITVILYCCGWVKNFKLEVQPLNIFCMSV